MSQPEPSMQEVNQLIKAGSFDAAEQSCRALIAANNDNPDAHNMMGFLLVRRGDFAGAVTHSEQVARLQPASPFAMANLARTLMFCQEFDRAIACLDRAAALNPAWPEPHIIAAEALTEQGRFSAAAARCAVGLERSPGNYDLISSQADATLFMGQAPEAFELLRSLIPRHPTDLRLHSNLAHYMNYLPGAEPSAVLEAHKAFARVLTRHHPYSGPRAAARARNPGAKLRVGIISPDLRCHSVAFFAEPFFEHHDRERIELYAYYTRSRSDAFTGRLRSFADHWRDFNKAPAAEIAARIREDQIDVLIELAGHTRGHSLEVMRCQPARVQVTYLGYPNTTGMSSIGFRIVDSHTDPPGESDSLSVEKLIRLDPCFLCYRPPGDAPAPSGPPSAHNGYVTFGSYNAVKKLNDEVIALWARILLAVPKSRLVLKAHGLAEAALAAQLRQRFESAGLDPDRVDLLGPLQADADHMGAYGQLDIALDPFPYNGTTTTCDALWMGVPVVTLAGRVHAGRVGVSLLSAAGLEALVARSPEDYIQIAVGLAADPARLAQLHRETRERMRSGPLVDGKGFSRRLETALLTLATA